MEETKDWGALTKKFEGLVKGEDPNDLKQKCLLLCKQYLSGNWSKISVDDMQIKRLAGGMTNMTYYCKIPENLRDCGTEPKEVVIRLFAKYDYKTLEFTDNTLEENIKYVLLSEIGFGPKVYGVDQIGVIQKYYKVYNY